MNFKKCLLVLILFTLTLISIKAGYAHIDSITMLSPAEGYTSLTSNPDFNFSVAGNESTYNCSLFVDDTLKDDKTFSFKELEEFKEIMAKAVESVEIRE